MLYLAGLLPATNKPMSTSKKKDYLVVIAGKRELEAATDRANKFCEEVGLTPLVLPYGSQVIFISDTMSSKASAGFRKNDE